MARYRAGLTQNVLSDVAAGHRRLGKRCECRRRRRWQQIPNTELAMLETPIRHHPGNSWRAIRRRTLPVHWTSRSRTFPIPVIPSRCTPTRKPPTYYPVSGSASRTIVRSRRSADGTPEQAAAEGRGSTAAPRAGASDAAGKRHESNSLSVGQRLVSRREVPYLRKSASPTSYLTRNLREPCRSLITQRFNQIQSAGPHAGKNQKDTNRHRNSAITTIATNKITTSHGDPAGKWIRSVW